MIIFYILYCVALHFNTSLEKWAYSLKLPIKLPTKEEQLGLVTFKNLPDQNYSQNAVEAGVNQPPENEQPPQQPPTQNYQSYAEGTE